MTRLSVKTRRLETVCLLSNVWRIILSILNCCVRGSNYNHHLYVQNMLFDVCFKTTIVSNVLHLHVCTLQILFSRIIGNIPSFTHTDKHTQIRLVSKGKFLHVKCRCLLQGWSWPVCSLGLQLGSSGRREKCFWISLLSVLK